MSAKTTRPRAGEDTVAEGAGGADQTVEQEAAGGVAQSTQTVAAESPSQDDLLAVEDDAEGNCDNHRGRKAVVTTNFPWVATQRFCNQCVPVQYRYLLP